MITMGISRPLAEPASLRASGAKAAFASHDPLI